MSDHANRKFMPMSNGDKKDVIRQIADAFNEDAASDYAAPVVVAGDPAIEIDYIGGICPVQAEGMIGNVKWYFRARGQSWSMRVGGDPICRPDVCFDGDYGDNPYAAGWMPQYVALEIIADCLRRYVTGGDE